MIQKVSTGERKLHAREALFSQESKTEKAFSGHLKVQEESFNFKQGCYLNTFVRLIVRLTFVLPN
jgi:hypothetical protein